MRDTSIVCETDVVETAPQDSDQCYALGPNVQINITLPNNDWGRGVLERIRTVASEEIERQEAIDG